MLATLSTSISLRGAFAGLQCTLWRVAVFVLARPICNLQKEKHIELQEANCIVSPPCNTAFLSVYGHDIIYLTR